MKYWLKIFMSVAIFFASVPSPAAELEDAINSAKDLRDTLARDLPPYVESNVKAAVQTNFLHLLYDHAGARNILDFKAREGIADVLTLNQEFDLLATSLGQNSANWDESMVRAIYYLSLAQRHEVQSLRLERDGVALKQSWSNQCSEPFRKRAAEYFNPLAYIPLIGTKNLSAPAPNFEIGAQVTMSFDGTTQSAGPSSMSMNETDAAVTTTGVALIYTSNPVGIIAGVIVLVVWALIKLGIFTEEVAKGAEKERKLQDINEEIHKNQLAVLQQAAIQLPGWVETSCRESFALESAGKMISPNLAGYAAQAQQAHQRFRAQVEALKTEYRARMANLRTVYYPAVQNKFLGLIQDRFSQVARTESEIKEKTENVIRPLGDQIMNLKSIDGPSLWVARQSLWTAILQMDASYRTASGYSFRPGSETAQFGSSWNQLGPKLKAVME